eukprot:TRINITY_DN2837_c0_g1_i3.p1 TRINITY_DN2837_c0_g1~~TRINITY_DN2837_c0_g1_i3.p1  ORF type:complete len:428 (-),score=123.55 TRINITY_DN2837_c0_g1_i3:644-1927(-)
MDDKDAMEEDEDPQTVYIQMRSSDEVIPVNLAEIPQNAQEILELLVSEQAPLETWLRIAVCPCHYNPPPFSFPIIPFHSILSFSSLPCPSSSSYPLLVLFFFFLSAPTHPSLSPFSLPRLFLFSQLEYYGRGDDAGYQVIMEKATSQEIMNLYNSSLEKVMLLNSMAFFSLQKVNKTNDEVQTMEWVNNSVNYLNRVNTIDFQQHRSWIGIGLAHIMKQEYAKAQDAFNTSLEAMADNTPAMLGSALLSFIRKDFAGALKIYKKLIETKPNCPPEVRVGLGLCYSNLGFDSLSRKCFERALELDPNNVEAIVALAVMELNHASGSPDVVRGAMNLLKRAYYLDKTNPNVLNRLADHFFHKRDLKRVEHLALSALDHANSSKIKAESFFQLGRAHHYLNDYPVAFKYYNQAVNLWKTYPLPKFGLGQM